MAESQKNEVNDAPKPTSPPSPAITLKIDAPVEDEAISERDDPMDELKACSPSSSSSSPSAEAKPSTSSSSSSSEPQRSKSLATTATNPFATSSQNKFSLRGGILKPPQLSLSSSSSSGANTKNNNVTSTSGTSASQPVAPSATAKHSFVLNPSRLNPFGLKNKGDDVAGSGAGGGSTTGSSTLATSSTISSSGSGLGTSLASEKKPPSVVVQVNGETPKFVPLMQQSENKSTNPSTASSSTSIISSTTNSSHHPQSLLSVPTSLVVTAATATSATVPQAVVATQPQLSSTSASSSGIVVQPAAAAVASSSSTAAASTFVFGQNIQDRVVKAAEDKSSPPEEPKPCSSSVSTSNGTTSSTTSTTEMLFSTAIKNDQIHNSDGSHKAGNTGAGGSGGGAPNKETKSLSESAREYEETSRANKRKYEEVEVKTGEEEETNILNITCKLFAFDKSSGWQERGRGTLRLNDLEKESDGHTQSRLVFRTTGSLRVVLNTKIWAEMTVEQASEKSVRFTALDANGEIKVFLAMAGIEDSKQLCAQIKSRVQKEVQKHKKVSSTTTSMDASSSEN